ncbi:MAG: Uma2 family endonuclease, partial [Anaerolineales bacterium]
IEGVVYFASPVSFKHGREHFDLITWMGIYRHGAPGVEGADNTTVRLDFDNEPQPDVILRYVEGGTSRTSGLYLQGPPELVAEVALSSVSIDMHDKLHAYRRNGVQEYIVWRVEDQALDWFSLEDGEFRRLEPDERGVIHSKVFPGLRLAVGALIAGDMTTVMAEQQRHD